MPLVSRSRTKEETTLPCGLYSDPFCRGTHALSRKAQSHGLGDDHEQRPLPRLPLATRPLEPC